MRNLAEVPCEASVPVANEKFGQSALGPVCLAGPEGDLFSNVHLKGNCVLTPCSFHSSSNKENIWVCEVAAIERTLQKTLFSLSIGEFQETLLFPSIDCSSFTGRLAIDSQ